METMGVRGIWGLEQLERTGISTWKCGLILLGVCVPLGFVAGFSLFGVIGGASLFIALALSRATQADLERFLPFDDGVQASIQILKPTKKIILVCFLFALSLNWGAIAVAVTGGGGVSLTEVHQEWVLERPGGIVLWYLTMPIFSLTMGIVGAAIFAQAKALSHAVRRVDIDILRLDRYSHLANPLIRVLSFLLILFSFFLAFSAIVDDPGLDRVVVLSIPVNALIALLLTAVYAHPIWVLKGRIRDAKQGELHCILTALSGDDRAMAESRLHERASGFTISELLAYRNFIESLWDWPVAPHLQRVVFFGLLPPLTWVLAGMVENAVGVMVGLN